MSHTLQSALHSSNSHASTLHAILNTADKLSAPTSISSIRPFLVLLSVRFTFMWIKNSFAFLQVTFNDSGRTIDSYKALIRRPFNAKATVLYSDCVFKNFFTLPGIDIWYFSDPGRNPGIILNNNG